MPNDDVAKSNDSLIDNDNNMPSIASCSISSSASSSSPPPASPSSRFSLLPDRCVDYPSSYGWSTSDLYSSPLTADGLLSRLDDKLDELESTAQLSHPQLLEQLVGGGFDDGSAAPAPRPGCGVRQPLADAVRTLTAQWSEGFIALAATGCPASMSLIAQCSLHPRGYGSIQHNRDVGIDWLIRAADAGDIDARNSARKIANKQLMSYLAKKHLTSDQYANNEIREQEMERMSVMDKRWSEEEKALAAGREDEFGGD